MYCDYGNHSMKAYGTTQITKGIATWRDYIELCKPRVIALMMLTSVIGMFLATPRGVPWSILLWGNLGIVLAAASAAVINHLVDRHIDILMQRTQRRPLAQGKIIPRNAIIFSAFLSFIAMFLLINFVNALTALLTFITLIGYAGFYSMYLKYATPQNIVIGGLAGAAPPLLGWVAVTGHIDPRGLLLVLIIFIWTPPHFWSLAIHRYEDYAKANIPMLPNTHGIQHTKLHVLLYTILLAAITLLPFAINMAGWVYIIGALLLNARFLYWAIYLWVSDQKIVAWNTFRFSIFYLMGLFIVLLFDHYFHYFL